MAYKRETESIQLHSAINTQLQFHFLLQTILLKIFQLNIFNMKLLLIVAVLSLSQILGGQGEDWTDALTLDYGTWSACVFCVRSSKFSLIN